MNSANDLVPSIARLKATDEGDDIVRLEEPSPSATSSEVLECKKGEPDPDEAPFVYRGVVYERDPEAEFPPFYYPKKALGATSSESVDYMTAYPTPESIKSLIQKRDTVRFIEPKVDAESKPNEAFCSWKLVEKYAELYVGKANGPKVSPFFEPTELYASRTWNLYFLYRPEGKRITWAPELFVPTYQLETLLDAVNEKLGTKLCIPQGSDEWLFRMSFGGDGCPVPRYAGSFNNGEEFDNLTKKIPGRRDSDNATSVRPVVLDKHLEKFAAINRAISEPRRKRDGGIARRQKMRDSWRQVSKRARRYLGLRPLAGPFYSIVSLDSPAPFMPVSPVRLISIDVEMFEFDHSVITEVGLAILDTWTVARVAPKEKGEAWFPFIKAHHFIVREHRHRVNRRFVSGCPDKFDFGKSQILPLPDISAALRKAVVSSHDYPGHGDVPIVLVAYNASGDIEALDSIGFSISEFPNCHDLLDVQQMHQHYHKRQNARSLTFVLDALDLDFKNLHNAGNDAVYTLQALIAMSTATATGRTGLADDDDDDWDTQEDTDGGGPIPPSMTPRTPRNRRNRGGF